VKVLCPIGDKRVILDLFFSANLVPREKLNLTQQKQTLIRNKNTTTQNKCKKLKPGLVASYDLRPGNGAGLFYSSYSPHGANRNKGLPLWSWPCSLLSSATQLILLSTSISNTKVYDKAVQETRYS